MNAQLIPSAEPFFLRADSDIGAVLTHGFTGAPKEMRWMGEYLQRQGINALGPRLFAHATRPEDMLRARYQDWLASLEDGYALLSGVVSQIYLIGLSMGGALSLTAASYLPVRGVITMSTPAYLPADWRLNHLNLLAKLQPFLPKSKEAPGSGWFDQQAWQDHISYPRNPTIAIGELKKLLDEMQAALPEVRVPALLIHSRNDHYVAKDSMERIYARLGSAEKQMLWVERSGHVIPRDAERESAFRAAFEFIQQNSAK
ncbi:MAG: alpha/beta fold hydrolase [Anaerolineales bacterium]